MTLSSFILLIHIVFGSIAILTGVIALFLPKGKKLHRQTGSWFVVAMIAMGITGIVLALPQFNCFFLIVGIFALYLTLTGWITIKRRSNTVGTLEISGMVIALCTGAAAGVISIWSIRNNQAVSNMPAALYIGYAVYGAIFGCLDGVKIRKGGWSGARRIADHVWRMIMALIFAVTALFIANPRVFPEALQTPYFQWSPVVLLFGALVYWLVRVLSRSWSFSELAVGEKTSDV